MTEEEIFAKVQEIAAEELDVDKAKITLTTNIKDDLDADSLDLFEIMSELEDEFEIELEADEDITTVEDVVKYVKKELDAKD
ncbi:MULTISPECIES: acyl carrier protein [Ligilactobacillus]|uniref:acyl carrier protein n=1 Tax=Ligilactobacillus TaxID=2767887 RepID=UPI001F9BC0C9|nr:acyl carrier protein [Ligilactobacillus hohenheimensis]HJC04322.1 acyl carrier protein [Candidatus Ligilactobacillus avistercoris]